jgi:serine/threonine protein kinase
MNVPPSLQSEPSGSGQCCHNGNTAPTARGDDSESDAGSGRHHHGGGGGGSSSSSSGNDSGGDRDDKRKSKFLARIKLFRGHASKQQQQQVAAENPYPSTAKSSSGTTGALPINRIGNESQFPQHDNDSSSGSSPGGVTRTNNAYADLVARIQQMQASLARERKLACVYHKGWEESHMENLKLQEYIRLLKDHIKILQSQIVCLNQQHDVQSFCQIPMRMTELPFLCPVDLHLREDYPRVGKYEKRRILGQGQFGIVWEATLHRPTNSSSGSQEDDNKGTTSSLRRKRNSNKERGVFAIKEINKGRCLNAYRKIESLNREVQALRVCRHSNIIRLVGVVHGPKAFYLVFEKAWIDAHALIRAYTETGKAMPMVTIQHIMKAVFLALQHMHANGVAHLDVKGENILIVHPDPDGRSDDRHNVGLLCAEHVRLGDFGLCVIDSENSQQRQKYQLQLSKWRQRRQLDRHNTFCRQSDIPEFSADSNSLPTASHNDVDHDHELDHCMTTGAPSMYVQGPSVIGTPGFYAPEMAEREQFDAMAADIWSAGTCLLEFTIGLADVWWKTYEHYGLLRRRLRHRGGQGCDGDVLAVPPDSDGVVDTQSRSRAAHPHAAPAKQQSTASSTTSTFKLERELYSYLYTQAELEWSDDCLKDLVLNKLMVKPESRSTASQALAHPWMASRSRGTI